MNYVKAQPQRYIPTMNHAGPATAPATWLLPLIWLTTAVSSIVFIEPAPHDALVFLLVLMLFPLGLRVPREINVPVFLLMLFAVANLVATLNSANPELTLRPLSIRTYMLFIWFFWASLVVADPPNFLRVIWSGYAFAALFAVGWGVLQYFGYLPDTLGAAFGRASGPFKDANVFAPFLVPVILYYVMRMLSIRGPALSIEAVKFLLVIYGLFLGFSRGAWLNLGVAFLLYIIFSMITARSLQERLRLMILISALAIAAVLTLYVAVNHTTAGQLFVERAALVQDYDIAQGGRFDTQSKALAEIGQNPIGVGPGMSGREFGGLEPHNLFLHVGVEGGWVAAITFYLFLIITLARGFVRVTSDSSLQGNLHIVLAALVGVLAQSFFIDSTHWRHLWLLLALTWAITIAIDRETKQADSKDYVQN